MESVIATREEVQSFLSTNTGCGYGDGTGSGEGSGDADGYGDGYGDGSGYGDSYGDIKALNGNIVDYIDNVPTIITQVRGNIACGYIVKGDLSLEHCFIAKAGNSFAHGKTLKGAIADVEAKEMERLPIEERIGKFQEVFGTLDCEHTGKEYYNWHHILTGSCQMGRDEFCEARDIDLSKKYTVKYFLDITKNSYGSNVIKLVREAYENMEE